MTNLTLKHINLMGDRGERVIVEAADWKGTKYLQKFGKHLTLARCGAPWDNYLIETSRLGRFQSHIEAQGLSIGWEGR
jgi:hypothetical protein